jgi:hypothetical protein
MELVLKLPSGKPPFIGILFDFNEELGAYNINKDLLLNPFKATFAIAFDPYGKETDLRMLCSNPLSIRFYRNLKYNPTALEGFLRSTRFIKQFNFSHLIRCDGKETVVRASPENKLFVIKIDDVKLRIADTFY